jgi:antitoxin PrlF
MNVQRGKLVSGGRLQIPADVRRKLGLSDGDPVTMEVVDGELRVRPFREVLRDIQRKMRELVPDGVSLADELIAERRAEAAKD